MPKEDCKYWDKCYQTNEAHLQRFNHPPKLQDQDVGSSRLPLAKVARKRGYPFNHHDVNPDSSFALFNSNNNSNAEERDASRELDSSLEEQHSSAEEQNTSGEEQNTSGEEQNTSGEEQNTSGEEQNNSNSGEEEQNNSIEEQSSSTDLEDENDKYGTSELRREAMARIGDRNYMGIMEKRIRLSVQQDYDNLCETPEFIRHYFLVRMPNEFFDFWKFLNAHKEGTTDSDLLDYMLKEYDLQLVGPFEYMGKRFHKAKIYEPGFYLRHWRFFYDPPEFQTVFVRRGTGIHYGYWRDKPEEDKDLLIARNDAAGGCEFEFVGGNMFEAFTYFLEKDCPKNPFRTKKIDTIKKLVAKYLEENSIEKQTLDELKNERNRRVVAKTFHRAGIVVNFDRSTQIGYRPLSVSDAELKKMLKPFDLYVEDEDEDEFEAQKKVEELKKSVLSKMQPVISAANIAMDESDHGTALELGIDLFASGHKELHMVIASLLVPTYSTLHRPQFIAINKAHMDLRRRGFKLSMFDV